MTETGSVECRRGGGGAAFETLHAVALAVWLAVVVGAGMAAAVVFPTMKELDPTLPGFVASPGDHWLIAGGHVGRTVFAISDRVQPVCVVIAVVSLAALTRMQRVGWGWLSIRWSLVGGAGVMAVASGVWLSPRMDANLVAYWEATKAGRVVEAGIYRRAFDADHPKASTLLSVTAGSVLLAIAGAAASRGRK